MLWMIFWWLFTPIGQVVSTVVFVIIVAALIAFIRLLWRSEHGK